MSPKTLSNCASWINLVECVSAARVTPVKFQTDEQMWWSKTCSVMVFLEQVLVTLRVVRNAVTIICVGI